MTSTVQRRLGEEAQRLQPLTEESVVRTPPLIPHPHPLTPATHPETQEEEEKGKEEGGGGSKNMGSL